MAVRVKPGGSFSQEQVRHGNRDSGNLACTIARHVTKRFIQHDQFGLSIKHPTKRSFLPKKFKLNRHTRGHRCQFRQNAINLSDDNEAKTHICQRHKHLQLDNMLAFISQHRRESIWGSAYSIPASLAARVSLPQLDDMSAFISQHRGESIWGSVYSSPASLAVRVSLPQLNDRSAFISQHRRGSILPSVCGVNGRAGIQHSRLHSGTGLSSSTVAGRCCRFR